MAEDLKKKPEELENEQLDEVNGGRIRMHAEGDSDEPTNGFIPFVFW